MKQGAGSRGHGYGVMITYDTSHITHHKSQITHHKSHITHQIITHHTSHIMHLILFYLSFMTLLSCQQTSIGSNETAIKELSVDTTKHEMDTIPKSNSGNELITDSSLTLDYIMGHFDPTKHPDFEIVDIKYADREGLYLRKDTY
ncbi:MAG: hypothetical protein ABIQ11_05450, partial [Saprospiraceae bacterium]